MLFPNATKNAAIMANIINSVVREEFSEFEERKLSEEKLFLTAVFISFSLSFFQESSVALDADCLLYDRVAPLNYLTFDYPISRDTIFYS